MPAKKKTAATAKPARLVRLHEATGSSASGWRSATSDALRRARADVPTPVAVEIVRQWADVEAGKIARFHVTARIAWVQRLAPPPTAKVRKRV